MVTGSATNLTRTGINGWGNNLYHSNHDWKTGEANSVKFIAIDTTNTYRVSIGPNLGPAANQSYTFYFDTGNYQVREGSRVLVNNISYNSGDTFEIRQSTSDVITFYHNNILVYTSLTTPIFVTGYGVDIGAFHTGTTIYRISINNESLVSTTNINWTQADIGVIEDLHIDMNIIQTRTETHVDMLLKQEVEVTTPIDVNVSPPLPFFTSTLTRVGPTDNWENNIYHSNHDWKSGEENNVKFTVPGSTGTFRVSIGPNLGPAANQAFSFVFVDSSYMIRENNTTINPSTSFSIGDTFEIRQSTSNIITFYHNDSLVYTSTTTPTFVVGYGVDIAAFNTGVVIEKITVNDEVLVAATNINWNQVNQALDSGKLLCDMIISDTRVYLMLDMILKKKIEKKVDCDLILIRGPIVELICDLILLLDAQIQPIFDLRLINPVKTEADLRLINPINLPLDIISVIRDTEELPIDLRLINSVKIETDIIIGNHIRTQLDLTLLLQDELETTLDLRLIYPEEIKIDMKVAGTVFTPVDMRLVDRPDIELPLDTTLKSLGLETEFSIDVNIMLVIEPIGTELDMILKRLSIPVPIPADMLIEIERGVSFSMSMNLTDIDYDKDNYDSNNTGTGDYYAAPDFRYEYLIDTVLRQTSDIKPGIDMRLIYGGGRLFGELFPTLDMRVIQSPIQFMRISMNVVQRLTDIFGIDIIVADPVDMTMGVDLRLVNKGTITPNIDTTLKSFSIQLPTGLDMILGRFNNVIFRYLDLLISHTPTREFRPDLLLRGTINMGVPIDMDLRNRGQNTIPADMLLLSTNILRLVTDLRIGRPVISNNAGTIVRKRIDIGIIVRKKLDDGVIVRKRLDIGTIS